LEYAGNPEVVYIPVLDLNGPKIKRFQNFISTAFLMGCIETGTQVICPGDRLD
jgi:hypothetical protein